MRETLTILASFGTALAMWSMASGAVHSTASPRAIQHASHVPAKTLFVASFGTNAVVEFPAGVNNPSPSGSITQGVDAPVALALDRNGTLYVANSRGGTGVGSISAYRAGATSPSLVITDGIFKVASLAVDRNGTLYVGERGTQQVQGTPAIVVYAKGSTTPKRTVFPSKLMGIPFMGGMNFDGAGNLFAAFFVYRKPPTHVVEFDPGLKNERDLRLNGIDGVDTDPALALDPSGNLYVGPPFGGISVYPSGSRKASRSIPAPLTGAISIDSDGNLYATDGDKIDEYAPGASQPFASVTSGFSLPMATAVR